MNFPEEVTPEFLESLGYVEVDPLAVPPAAPDATIAAFFTGAIDPGVAP